MGTYALLAFKGGYLYDFSNPPVIILESGRVITQNLILLPANSRSISGRLLDLANGAGIPRVQMFVESSAGLATICFSDSDGYFTAWVSTAANDWKVTVSEGASYQLGYVEAGSVLVDTSAGNVTNLNLRMTKGEALIHGRLVDQSNRPVAGMNIGASGTDGFGAAGTTDADGNYGVSVTSGEWNVWPDEESLTGAGLVVGQGGRKVTALSNQAFEVNFAARPVTVHLRGRVVDESGAPISGLGIGVSDWIETAARRGSVDSEKGERPLCGRTEDC